jgi:hypothetical protein
MNLALPALVVVLALLPGIAFFKAYLSGKFPRRAAQISPLAEVALYIVFALPIDAFALTCFGPRSYVVATAVRLLTNSLDKAEVDVFVGVLQTQLAWLSVQYLVLLAAVAVSGLVLRRIVWTLRLDVHVPMLRMRHHWYYTLQGRLRGYPRERDIIPYADVMVEMPGEQPRLYRGIVKGFDLDPDGQVGELILTNTLRGKGRAEKFEFLPMPSDRFLIRGRFIHSINMSYYEQIYEYETRWARAKRKLNAILRSLILEEA